MDRLDDRLAVITGGTSCIGLAVAQRFLAEGARLIVTGRRQKELDEALAVLGARASGFRGDVAALPDLDRLFATLPASDQIDLLVANAGVAEAAPIETMSEAHFDRVFGVNVKGAAFTVQKALPRLKDGASIILMGSVAGSKGTPGFGAYGATKAALRNFARTWTVELKDRHIRVNVISPGPIDTPATQRFAPEDLQRLATTVPMGRIVSPAEVADAALFLASDKASFVTGIELFIDGGRAQV